VESIQEISAADREGAAPTPTDPALEAEAEEAAAVSAVLFFWIAV
jgi:hypothetical protein